MKLEIRQGTDSHIFPYHLAVANRRTDDIAYRDEFPSLSYSANMSGVDADALLNTQLTVVVKMCFARQCQNISSILLLGF